MKEGPRRPGDPPALVAAADKIRRELGWPPRYTELRPIVETAWNWHKAHPSGYPGLTAGRVSADGSSRVPSGR